MYRPGQPNLDFRLLNPTKKIHNFSPILFKLLGNDTSMGQSIPESLRKIGQKLQIFYQKGSKSKVLNWAAYVCSTYLQSNTYLHTKSNLLSLIPFSNQVLIAIVKCAKNQIHVTDKLLKIDDAVKDGKVKNQYIQVKELVNAFLW